MTYSFSSSKIGSMCEVAMLHPDSAQVVILLGPLVSDASIPPHSGQLIALTSEIRRLSKDLVMGAGALEDRQAVSFAPDD